MYNILVKDEWGCTELIFRSDDLDEATRKINSLVEASTAANLLSDEIVYQTFRLEKSELISRFDVGQRFGVGK